MYEITTHEFSIDTSCTGHGSANLIIAAAQAATIPGSFVCPFIFNPSRNAPVTAGGTLPCITSQMASAASASATGPPCANVLLHRRIVLPSPGYTTVGAESAILVSLLHLMEKYYLDELLLCIHVPKTIRPRHVSVALIVQVCTTSTSVLSYEFGGYSGVDALKIHVDVACSRIQVHACSSHPHQVGSATPVEWWVLAGCRGLLSINDMFEAL